MGRPPRNQRGFFPLPVPAVPPGIDVGDESVPGLSRYSLNSLDQLYYGVDRVKAPTVGLPAQSDTVVSIASAAEALAAEFASLPGASECFSELTVGCDCRGQPTSCVPLNVDSLALPAQGEAPKAISGLLGPTGPDFIEGFVVTAFCQDTSG